MTLRNTKYVYGSVAKFFHWLMFLLIATMLILGYVMVGLDPTPDKFKLYGLHKSIGATILTLAAIRLIWRLANPTPLLPADMNRMEQFLAHASHAGLYFLMFAMPLTGWTMSSALGFPVSVFGWFTLPNLIEPNKALGEDLRWLHWLFSWALVALVSLHALAALLHHFYHKDNVLRRMLPFVKTGEEDAQ